jgi:hypothetical protein
MITRARLGDGDPHRNALDDFREVARRVVWWKQSELGARRAAYTRNLPGANASAIGVDLELDLLAGPYLRELRFLEVCSHPDASVGNDAHEWLACRYELADFHLLSGHFS